MSQQQAVRFGTPVVVALSLMALACGTDRDSGDRVTSTGLTSLGDDGTAGATDGETDDSEGDGEGGAYKFDLGLIPDLGPPDEDEGCQKVDILFVIDDSGSMGGNQVNLANSFPGFVAEMQTALEDVDSYHVGVITSDAYGGNSFPCNVMGGLVTRTQGFDASNMTCGPYADGHRFMTESDDLGTSFACAAKVGSDGNNDEHPMEALATALSPELNAPGECNDGFLRDDALLVVVIITDEEDDHEYMDNPGSPGDPPEWFHDVVGTKGGVEENVVMLSVVGTAGTPYPSSCVFDETALRIIEFTEMFTHDFVGDVCAQDYSPFFHDAVEVIDVACDGFKPAG